MSMLSSPERKTYRALSSSHMIVESVASATISLLLCTTALTDTSGAGALAAFWRLPACRMRCSARCTCAWNLPFRSDGPVCQNSDGPPHLPWPCFKSALHTAACRYNRRSSSSWIGSSAEMAAASARRFCVGCVLPLPERGLFLLAMAAPVPPSPLFKLVPPGPPPPPPPLPAVAVAAGARRRRRQSSTKASAVGLSS